MDLKARFLLVILALSIPLYSWAELPADQKGLLESLESGSEKIRLTAIGEIIRLNHKAPIFLDRANAFLNEYIAAPDKTTASTKEVALYIRMLAYSGSAEHIKTLETLSNSKNKAVIKSSKNSLKHSRKHAKVEAFAQSLNDQFADMSYTIPMYSSMLKRRVGYIRQAAMRALYDSHMAVRSKEADNPFELDAAEYSDEKLLAMLNSEDAREQNLATRILYHIGARNKALYKNVAQQANSVFANIETLDEKSRDRRVEINKLPWLLRSLSSSGDRQYLSLFDRAISLDHRSLTFHAEQAKAILPEFEKWHVKMDAVESFEDLSEKELYLLVLDAPYLTIKNCVLVYFQENNMSRDSEVVETSLEEFSVFYPFVRRKGDQVEPAARMLQIMGATGDKKYLPVMEASLTAPSKHVIAHAAKNIKVLKKTYKKNNATRL